MLLAQTKWDIHAPFFPIISLLRASATSSAVVLALKEDIRGGKLTKKAR
jgi:hypothetical protein